ncbi:RsfS/YbeB/iojap family protein, partial [Salmonella enterica subsp. enterica serovar Montevideo]|nr:RsfS/YbeB/iojap family protein [Salmonella enterica subsp. enterica serovar Montevideo]
SRHVMSIADHVVQSSRAAGMLPLGVEGENAADWIVVDLGDVISGSCGRVKAGL